MFLRNVLVSWLSALCLFVWGATWSFAKGPLDIVPRVNLAWQYDDNIAFSQRDAVSDLLTYVSPGVHASMYAGGWNGEIDYEVQRVSYYHHSANDSFRHYLSLDGRGHFLENWHLAFEDSYARSEDPVQIAHVVTGIRYENIKYDYNQGSVALTRDLGRGNRLVVGYDNMFFKSRSQGVSDTFSHRPYLDLTYWVSTPTGVRLQAGETLGLFDTSDDFSEPDAALTLMRRLDWDTTVSLRGGVAAMDFHGQTPDYDTYDLGLGLERTFGRRMRLATGLGYYYKDGEQGAGDDQGVSGYVNLWRHGRAYDVSLELTRGYDEIYFDGEDLGFSECWVAGARMGLRAGHGLSLGLVTSYREDSFVHVEPRIKERTWSFYCHADWRLLPWCTLTLAGLHWDREANYDDYSYLDNRLLLSLSFFAD